MNSAATIRGKGGHAARPHQTIDPVAVAAQLVTLIYQALPRQTDARDPLVVTIGQMQAGHASNVIPDTANLRGTVRTFSGEVSANARETILRLCKGPSRMAVAARQHLTFSNTCSSKSG